MRCPKCQYLGFEPSPRCKNCGYDFSFSGDDLPGLQLVSEEPAVTSSADFDLHLLDEAPSPAMPARGFDLDELLSRGRSEPASSAVASVGRRDTYAASAVATPPAEDVFRITEAERSLAVSVPEPVLMREMAEPVVERQMIDVAPAPVAPAVLVAVPEPLPPAPVAPVAVSSAVKVRVAAPPPSPEPAPETSELPLFMQGLSEAKSAKPAVPRVETPAVTLEMAVEALAAAEAEAPAPAVEEIDDRPLVQVPAVPRAPLAVRRTTPDPARLRAKYSRAAVKAESQPAGDLLKTIDEVEPMPAVSPAVTVSRLSAEPTPESLPAGWLQGVSAGKRLSAAAMDAALMVGLNAAILWLTLAICGIPAAQARLLPLVPLAVFFVLVDGGYLVLFTAACGQTIGKMAAGIRVVGTSTSAVINDRISVGQALARAISTFASCLPLGAGFWVALIGDGRALHDRVAHTRVVRA